MKLTAAQRDVLARAAAEFSSLPSMAVTRRALWVRKLIEPSTPAEGATTRWRITDRGRAALEQSKEGK